MKRLILPVLLVLFLIGCAKSNEPMDKIMALRTEIMNSTEVSFDAVITADYTDELQVFGLRCVMDEQGDLSFQVTSPQTIAGITGTISSNEGFLTFDEEVLAFEALADGRIAPVCAPWIFMNTLRSGYIKACSADNDRILAVIDDSYSDNALQLEVMIDNSRIPYFAEISWNNYRFISMEIDNFCCV